VEALRTRLQLAAYKVKTEQTKTPFRWLHRPGASSERRPMRPVPRIKTEEDVIQNARTQATDQKKPTVRNLDSLPMPTIAPTAYSARYMGDHPEAVPSSSPISTGSGGVESSCTLQTETLTPKNHVQRRTYPVQLSSPPGSEGDERANGEAMHRWRSEDDVRSSVVIGKAANGLLELIRAAAGS
jgi:Whi5 like